MFVLALSLSVVLVVSCVLMRLWSTSEVSFSVLFSCVLSCMVLVLVLSVLSVLGLLLVAYLAMMLSLMIVVFGYVNTICNVAGYVIVVTDIVVDGIACNIVGDIVDRIGISAGY